MKHVIGDLVHWAYKTPVIRSDGFIERGKLSEVIEVSYDNDCRIIQHGIKIWISSQRIAYNLNYVLDELAAL